MFEILCHKMYIIKKKSIVCTVEHVHLLTIYFEIQLTRDVL